ncbi:MAG: TIGR03915 family putative DNA repair protein, partial [Acetatifactor sp.]|nr:TIGR03915 family putative DNA repair protein [Acetatifactor sp.]
MYIYRCEDTLEGVFTAIYRVYEEHRNRDEVRLALEDETWLFSTEISVETDSVRAEKVIRTLRKRFGDKDYEYLCLALATPDMEKAQAVYRTVAAGLDGGYGFGQLFDNLTDEYIHKTFRLATNAGRESGHLREFVRFAELENGVLYSKIAPRSNILTFLMPHFADRFPEEDFILHDVGRDWFGVHPAGAQWFLLRGEALSGEYS